MVSSGSFIIRLLEARDTIFDQKQHRPITAQRFQRMEFLNTYLGSKTYYDFGNPQVLILVSIIWRGAEISPTRTPRSGRSDWAEYNIYLRERLNCWNQGGNFSRD